MTLVIVQTPHPTLLVLLRVDVFADEGKLLASRLYQVDFKLKPLLNLRSL